MARDDDEFWDARYSLKHVRTVARARRVSPWAALGIALTRVIVAIAPHIQLPALVGGQMSLNLFLALVGRSGAGKDAALAIGDAAIGVGPVEIRTPGSGEGIAHCFVTRTTASSSTPRPCYSSPPR
jgi:hypothetical protein